MNAYIVLRLVNIKPIDTSKTGGVTGRYRITNPPTILHMTAESAHKEAARLAKEYRDEFGIFALDLVMRPIEPQIENVQPGEINWSDLDI